MKCKLELVLGLFFALSITAFSQVSVAGRCDALKPGQAAFFEHGKYKGACVVRKVGRYSNSKAIGIGNDKISSIKMGPHTQVSLCMHSNFKGGCKTYTRSMASLGKMNDKTSSAIIGKDLILSATCEPKANQAAFFEHGKYKGACVIRKIGRYSNSKAIGIGNDKISSIKVGPRTQVSLCMHSNFKGGCKTYTRSMASLGKMNDKTSSAIIGKDLILSATCEPKANQVAFFEHSKYRGTCAVRNKGRYASAKAIGIGNDKISSIKMGPGSQIRLCKDNNFKGSCKTYTKSMASLGKMNDKTSSAIIGKDLILSVTCEPKANQAAFFEHNKYQGTCVVRNIGRYANAKAMGIGNDKISSVKVGSAVQVKLCNDSNFRKCDVINTTEMLWGRNDRTSSVIIVKAMNNFDSTADKLSPPQISASNCSEEKIAEIYVQTGPKGEVLIDCNVTLEPRRRVLRRLIFEGNKSTGVTLDCNGAILNGNTLTPNHGRDMIEVRSKKTGANTWIRPQNILIKNCVIIGSIRVWGMGKNGEHPDIKASSRREASNSKHVQRVRNNAPKNIVFDGMEIYGVGRNPFYFSPGVTYSKLINSELTGKSTKVGIYLDAESAYNTFENNFLHVDTKEDKWAKKVGYNRGWPQMAIDGSSHNKIINNRFASLRNGGIYLYRNCGEGGTIRHTPPEHNTITNNVFHYKKYKGSNPAIYLGSRDYGSFERASPYNHCDDDDGRHYGSSRSEKDYAKYNTVNNNKFYKRKIMKNQHLMAATPEDLIRTKDRSTNSPNYFSGNKMIE